MENKYRYRYPSALASIILLATTLSVFFRYEGATTQRRELSLSDPSTQVVKDRQLNNNGIISEEEFSKALYWDLSCPYEMSVWSCVHQEKPEESNAGRQALMEMRQEIVETFTNLVPKPNTRIFLSGDSTMRQIFISLSCLLHSFAGENVVKDVDLKWFKKWPCIGVKNCVESGPHSGINVGTIYFTNGAEIHFNENPKLANLNIFNKMTTKDTMLMSLGLHNDAQTSFTPMLQEKIDVFQKVYQRKGNHRPWLWYMTTPSQHFQSPNGLHSSKARELTTSLGSCRSNIMNNPRHDTEMKHIIPGRNVDQIFEYDDLAFGDTHVGAKGETIDCSHYCMPGPPDRMATKLYNVWATTGGNTEGHLL